MSSPVTYTWSDVINNFMDAVKSVLYEIGKWIVDNAAAVATALIGVSVVYAITRGFTRIPFIRSLLGRLF